MYSQPVGRKNYINTKIKIHKKVIDEVTKEHNGAREFIHNKTNELCLEHGISTDKVRIYTIMFLMPRTQFGYIYSLE